VTDLKEKQRTTEELLPIYVEHQSWLTERVSALDMQQRKYQSKSYVFVGSKKSPLLYLKNSRMSSIQNWIIKCNSSHCLKKFIQKNRSVLMSNGASKNILFFHFEWMSAEILRSTLPLGSFLKC
jgi:hypothetical protein